jgi:hypothetical protein
VAGKLELVVRFLAQPDQRLRLTDVYRQVWWGRGREVEAELAEDAGPAEAAAPTDEAENTLRDALPAAAIPFSAGRCQP